MGRKKEVWVGVYGDGCCVLVGLIVFVEMFVVFCEWEIIVDVEICVLFVGFLFVDVEIWGVCL